MKKKQEPTPQNREESGRFKKGYSGNPGGRPKDIFGLAQFARENSFESLQKLVEMMQNKEKTLPPQVVLAAIAQLLDRGMGKPMQPTMLQHLDEDGKPTGPVLNVNITPHGLEPAATPKTNGSARDASH